MVSSEWDAFHCFNITSRKFSTPITCLHAECAKVIGKKQWKTLVYKLRSVESEAPYEAFKELEDIARLCLCKSCEVHPHRQTALIDAWRPDLDLVILTYVNESNEKAEKLLSRSKKAQRRERKEANAVRAECKEKVEQLKTKIKSQRQSAKEQKEKLRTMLDNYKTLLDNAKTLLRSHKQEVIGLEIDRLWESDSSSESSSDDTDSSSGDSEADTSESASDDASVYTISSSESEFMPCR